MNKENKYIKRFMKSLFHRSLLFFGIILYSASISTVSAADNSAVKPPLIQGVWQFSSPMSDSDEGSFYALLGHASDALSAGLPADDFWHSNWHDGPQPSGSHYFQVEMINPELLPDEIYFVFTRRPVGNDHTIEWSVRGTNSYDASKEACEELARISTPYTSNTETIKSDNFNPKGYKYLRFYSEAQSGENFGSRGYFHLSRFQLYPAKAISSYEAALLAIEDGAIYCIFTEVNGQKYYIAADGTLTADKNGGNLYTFEKVSPLESEREYEYGFLINSNNNTRFSNPRTQEIESFTEGRLNVTTLGRDTWEAQVFFENDEGRFAIRSTNASLTLNEWSTVGSAFWTYYEHDGIPLAGYSFDQNYIWQVEKKFAITCNLVENGQVISTTTTSMPFGVAPIAPNFFGEYGEMLHGLYDLIPDVPVVTKETSVVNFKPIWAGPFELSNSFASAKWYNMNIRSGWQVSKCSAEPYTMKNNPTEEELASPEFQWAFVPVQDQLCQIIVYNRASGPNATLSKDGDNVVMRDGTYVWEIFSNYDGFVLREIGTEKWINQLGGGNTSCPLGLWDDSNGRSDDGSTFRVEEVLGLDQTPALVNGVYQLATPADLVWFAANAATEGLKGELTNAIDLSNTKWKPIGTKTAPFTGFFNGHLYPITGISNMLFGTTSGATITGVALESGNIEIPGKSDYAEHAGTIIGEAGTGAPTTLSFSYSKVNITTTGSCDTGGLSGKFYGTIYNCSYIGIISGEDTIGGMIGSSSEVATPANISNSYSYVESFGGSGWYKDALVGWLHDGSSMNNCYAIENVGSYAEHYNNATVNNVKTISKDVFTSGEVCFKLNEAQGKTVWFQTLGKDVHPVLDSTHGVVIKKADGNYANASNDGVVRIGTAEALVAYSAFINGGTDADAILTADIDMSGVDYTPIGCEANLFTNSFDGQGHIISNLTVTKGVDVSGTMGGVANGYVGLFGAVSGGATIKNFTLKNARLSGPAFIGVVGGSYGDGTVTIDAVGFEGEAIGTAQNVSGIIGVNMNSTATFHISNCYVTGKVAGGYESAAITGWTGGGSISGCWSTAEVKGNDAGKAFYRNDATVWSDCYDIYGEQVNKIPEGALASGELAYKLNGNSADGAWRQTIGQDKHPVFAASSKKVYAKPSGGFRCDGLPLGNTTYTNNVVTPTISAHEYDGFICKNCGQINPEFVQPKNGVYALGTAEQLAWFACKINTGADKALNAVLTADIDMSAYPGIENTIGTDGNGYAGTFDGQFHTVKVAYVNNADGGTEVRHSTALFRFLNGGTVKNIITTGTITTNQKYASGLVGKTQGNGGTMENVETHIVINSAVDGDGTHAGFLGVADAPATIITNALSAIVINGDRTTCCGGLIGWANQPVTFNKCLMVGEINVQDDGSATFSRNPGGNIYNNCYYRDGVKELQDNGNATKVSADVLKSGELTYSLNYPDVNGGIWRQNLDNGHTKDSHPVLSWEHGQVFKVAGGYTNKDSNANGFRYYMLEIDDIAGGDRIQISEFDFLDRNGKELESLRVTGGPNDFFSGESWTNLCDGETATKYCGPFRRSEGVYLYFDAQTIVKPVAYRMYTANDTKDFSERNPVSWKLWGSNTENKQPDHESWVLVDERMDDHTMQATNYMPYDFQIMPKCRYYQFVIEANGGDIAIQLSEFDLIDRNNQDVDPLVLYASTGHHYDNETQENLFDNDVMTKFCGMFTDKTIIYIDAGKPVALSGYRMTTANDTQSYPDRNPVSWSLLGSNTKSDRPNDDVWTLLDHHENDYTLGAVNYTPYTFFFNNSQPSLAGDVNADGNIDVADLTGVVSFILEDADASLIFSAADMDANGKVEVNDYAALVNVILSHGNNSVKARRIPSRQEALISLTAIGEDELLVSLMGDRQFTGIQFDLQLPEGVTLDEDGMVCESRQHGCWSVRREDGTYRVLCSSMTNAELRKGVVLRLKTKVDTIGEAIISNVVLSDVNAKRHEAALVKTIISDTTGIMSEDLTTQTTAVFDLQGRRTNLQRKGIYIVNGKKVVIK